MRKSIRRAETAEVNVTPVLDVVFILLIFFIVTSVFDKEEAMEIEPPRFRFTEIPMPTIIVSIDQDDLVRVNGRLSDVSMVRANLEALRAEQPDSALMIQAHPDARTGTIIKVRDQAASARIGLVNVILTAV